MYVSKRYESRARLQNPHHFFETVDLKRFREYGPRQPGNNAIGGFDSGGITDGSRVGDGILKDRHTGKSRSEHRGELRIQLDRSEFRARLQAAQNEFSEDPRARTIFKNSIGGAESKTIHHCSSQISRAWRNRTCGDGLCYEFSEEFHGQRF